MKKLIYLSLVSLFLITFANQIQSQCEITISVKSFDFPANGGNNTFDVKNISFRCDWTITNNYSWLSFSPQGSRNSSKVTVTCAPNTTNNARTAKVKLNGVKPITITINQEALFPPSKPIVNQPTNITPTSFDASWRSVSNASYRIDVSTSRSFSDFVGSYNNYTVNGTNTTISGLNSGTTYYYRVRAENAVGTSDNSLVGYLTTTTNPPVIGNATHIMGNSFRANWTAPSGVTGLTGYLLEVADNNNFSPCLPNYNNISVNGLYKIVTGLVSGVTYYYRVKATYNSVNSDYSQYSELITLNTPSISEVTYNQPVTSFSTSLPVGSLPGSVDVSPTGAANYQIPISLPPGTAGMVPNLSIAYSSQSPAGLMGTGWTISGFSSITRIPTNLQDDGYVDGVDFDDNDKFALDGNRLVEINGTYGTNGTEYRTQMETFSRIFSYGNAGGGPERFVVETKDGKKLSYGTTANSRFIATELSSAPAISWLLDKVEDMYGNYYTISYTMENNEYFPNEIKYTGNTNASLSTYNGIKFLFDRKPESEWNIAYIGGAKVISSAILREIKIENEENVAFRYEFKYKSGISAKLVEVAYFIGQNSINTTKINWGGENNNINFTSSNLSDIKTVIPGDFNGDGKTDIAALFHKTNENGEMVFDEQGRIVYRKLVLYYSNGDGSGFIAGPEDALDFNVILYPGDYNGDGKTDLFMNASHNLGVYFSSNSGFGFQDLGILLMQDVRIADFNGDGKSDLLNITHINLSNYPGPDYKVDLITLNASNTNLLNIGSFLLDSIGLPEVYVGDFNGNGLSDIIINYNINGKKYTAFKEYDFSSKSLKTLSQKTDMRYFGGKTGDFNGDGKTDLLSYNAAGYIIYYNLDNLENIREQHLGFLRTITTDKYKSNIFVSDFNGDGKDDILEQYVNWNGDVASSSTFNVYIAQGQNFVKSSTIGDGLFPEEYQFYVFNDFNGDGKADCFLHTGYYKDYRKILYFGPNSKENLVSSITNGFNKQSTFEYLPLTKNNVYFSGSGNDLTNNVIEIRPAINVVSKLYTPDGSGGNGQVWTSYQYQGLKIHQKGKGFLGFEKVYSTNSFGDKTEMEFGYNTSFFNTFLKKSRTLGMAYPKETTLENKVVPISSTLGKKRFLPYVEWNEEYDGLNKTTIKTNFLYDNFGNITYQEIIHGIHGKTQITNEYIAANTWCSAALKKSTVVKSRTGIAGTHTKVSENLFQNGKLTGSIDYVGTDKPLTTSYVFNPGTGLVTQTSVSVPGEVTRLSTVEYDSKWRFITKQTNPKGFTTEKTYDPKNGNVLTETDILGLVKRNTYDALGNLQQSTSPVGNKVTINRGWTNNNPVNSMYYIEEVPDGAYPSKAYYTHLGQKILVEGTGFNGSKIYGKTEYNAKGQLYKEYLPNTSSSGGDATTYAYDNYGRITSVAGPTGTTSYTYGECTSTIKDPAGKTSTKTINAYGEVIKANDDGGEITYEYNPAGLPKTITAPGGAIVTMNFDVYGNKLDITDPDAGKIEYTYDGFGNLKTQKDAKGNQYTMTYDILGRLTSKTGPDGTTTYVFDNATNGKGQIASIFGPNGISQSFEYDQYGRMNKSTEVIDNKPFVYSYTFDQYGNPAQTTYPSGFAIKSTYQNGFLTEIRKASDNGLIWKTESENEFGQLTQGLYGNNKRVTNTYDQYHRPLSFVYDGYATLGYDFDKTTGNLKSRSYSRPSLSINLTDSFTYDALNRLDKAKIGNNAPYLDMEYDITGNITSKTGVGSYEYNDPIKIHAVTDIKGNTGSIPSIDQIITYNSFNKVSIIEEGINKLDFTYGLDQERMKTVLKNNGTITKTKYFIGEYEEEITGSGTRKIHYIPGGNGLAAVFIIDIANPEGKMYYTYTDHLGSILAIADASGNILEEQSFDPWGRRRNPTNWSYENIPAFNILDRGFTGHQHLYEFGLINMNGRLYDPVLGRMLSPDPYIQMPDFSQNFNRYSYCWNNPLIYTDPSGEFIFSLFLGPVGAIIDAACWGAVLNGGIYTASTLLTGQQWDWGKFGRSLLVGAISGATGKGLDLLTKGFQIYGAVPSAFFKGSAQGISGGLTGGISNVIMENKWDAFGGGFVQGFATGFILGSIDGGVEGYKNAKSAGANPWSGELYTNQSTYMNNSKAGIPSQPDNSKHCYAYSMEYADKGRGNHQAIDFINAAGNANGADPSIVAGAMGIPSKSIVSPNTAHFDLFGGASNGKELIGIKNNHVFNIKTIVTADKLKIFGGGYKRVLRGLCIWDPISRNTSVVGPLQKLILLY
jgi:RHS repeat-associated protein